MKAGLFIIMLLLGLSGNVNAQDNMLTEKQKRVITISAFAARGELEKLKPELNAGLDAGLTVNEIKEALVHLYAYSGFPRSIRGLQTFMEVLDARKAVGMKTTTVLMNSKTNWDSYCSPAG